GLRDQMRRSAVSIMSNIAEGFESRTRPLFIDYLGRAKGSAGELRAQAYVALDAGYVDVAIFEALCSQAIKCSRQLSNLMWSRRPAASVSEDGDVIYDIYQTDLRDAQNVALPRLTHLIPPYPPYPPGTNNDKKRKT
ncbi:MAG: four helix bundle protein, partial [Thermoflexales bacterium]